VRQTWSALCPDLSRRNWETDTTFKMLSNAILLFGMVLVLWGAGAGLMRTVWLYDTAKESSRWLQGCSDDCNAARVIGIVVFALVQMARAISALLALALMAAAIGGALGFLFGLPRPPTAAEQQEKQRTGARWKLSTNLTEISDWLTKIIVGVGLVEATKAWGAFTASTVVVAGYLFESRHGSPAVVGCALAGGAVFGFLFAYLYTQLIIARLLAEADTGLTAPSKIATQHFRLIKPSSQAIAPRISRSRDPRALATTARPELPDVQTALQIASIPFGDLTQRPDVTFEDVWNWGRAKAILNDYCEAAKAYIRLLGTERGDTSPVDDPHLLLEAARVLNAAGPTYQNAAAALAQAALQVRDKAEQEVRDAITGDVAALLLSGRLPGGYREALTLLKSIGEKPRGDSDTNGRLHLLRALAKGQKYKALLEAKAKAGKVVDDDPELKALREEIREDLKFAFGQEGGESLKEANRPFWDPHSEQEDLAAEEADLRAVYQADTEFQQLVDTPPAPAPDKTGQ
jgi:hypothetical protein